MHIASIIQMGHRWGCTKCFQFINHKLFEVHLYFIARSPLAPSPKPLHILDLITRLQSVQLILDCLMDVCTLKELDKRIAKHFSLLWVLFHFRCFVESLSVWHTHFRYKSLLPSFIFNAVNLAIITFVLIPANTAGAFLWIGFAGYFACLLCKDFIFGLEAALIRIPTPGW